MPNMFFALLVIEGDQGCQLVRVLMIECNQQKVSSDSNGLHWVLTLAI